jgi:hypothetical protein
MNEVKTIDVKLPFEQRLRPDSPQALLKALEAYTGDEEALREHFAQIARERQREREDAERDSTE